MPALTLRDRFYTRRVAAAMTSPLGIVLAGAGTAVGIAIGLPIFVAPLLGVAAWAARVAAVMPRGFDADGIDPFELDEPWRSYVWKAKRARRHFAEAVKTGREGPLRDRLEQIGKRITDGVEECWRVAQGGDALAKARARIDVASITGQLSELHAQLTAGQESGPLIQTIEALESQLATAKRMDEVIVNTSNQLRLLDARLDEAVTRAIELSVRAHTADEMLALGADIDGVVSEMESLRQALDETDHSTYARPTRSEPAGPAQPAPGALPPPPPPDPLLHRESEPQPQSQPRTQPPPLS